MPVLHLVMSGAPSLLTAAASRHLMHNVGRRTKGALDAKEQKALQKLPPQLTSI